MGPETVVIIDKWSLTQVLVYNFFQHFASQQLDCCVDAKKGSTINKKNSFYTHDTDPG
jgi:hypothetical protein